MKPFNELTPFGQFMHELRDRKGITTNKMCRDLGVTRSYLSLIECGSDERGTSVPTYLLKRIYQVYQLTLEECICLVDSVMETNEDLQRLSLLHLSDKDKEKILSFAYWLMLD